MCYTYETFDTCELELHCLKWVLDFTIRGRKYRNIQTIPNVFNPLGFGGTYSDLSPTWVGDRGEVVYVSKRMLLEDCAVPYSQLGKSLIHNFRITRTYGKVPTKSASLNCSPSSRKATNIDCKFTMSHGRGWWCAWVLSTTNRLVFFTIWPIFGMLGSKTCIISHVKCLNASCIL